LTLVNLYSDTQTRPTSAMRHAMAEAEVGDEQRFEDPQVTELCSRVAALLGFEAAVFLPSGTMCNEIAFRLHIRPGGDEAILHRLSHPIIAEAGGRVWPLEQLRDVVGVAKEAGLRLHMDGARLMNAVVASGVPAAEMTRGFDTAWLDFTKGLGAPVGACLAGSAELIEEAWRYKQMLGGAMRQAGIVAAGALYALDHHVDRLADDHALARELARGLAELPGVTIDPDAVETNIVIFEHDEPERLCASLQEHGVLMGAVGGRRVRAVTHLDVDADGIRTALNALERVCTG
jgi:threonine aldolase